MMTKGMTSVCEAHSIIKKITMKSIQVLQVLENHAKTDSSVSDKDA